MKILALVFAAAAFGELYMALDERDPWLSVGAAATFTVLCHAASRRSVRTAPEVQVAMDVINKIGSSFARQRIAGVTS